MHAHLAPRGVCDGISTRALASTKALASSLHHTQLSRARARFVLVCDSVVFVGMCEESIHFQADSPDVALFSVQAHPSRHGTYDGISMHPYETVLLRAR